MTVARFLELAGISGFVDQQMALINAITRKMASEIIDNAIRNAHFATITMVIATPLISGLAMVINVLLMGVVFQVLTLSRPP